jgi:hypothetical protein
MFCESSSSAIVEQTSGAAHCTAFYQTRGKAAASRGTLVERTVRDWVVSLQSGETIGPFKKAKARGAGSIASLSPVRPMRGSAMSKSVWKNKDGKTVRRNQIATQFAWQAIEMLESPAYRS